MNPTAAVAVAAMALLAALASWWGAPVGAGAPSLVRVVTSRLALFALVAASMVAALFVAPEGNQMPLLLAAAGGSLGAALAGRIAALSRPAPRGLKWILSPYIGVALWAHWLSGVLSSRSRRRAVQPEEPAREAEADSRSGVRELASLTVGQVMVPRSEVVAIEAQATVERAARLVRQTPHALYPVYKESFDQPLGMLRMMDLAGADSHGRTVGDLAREAPLVPATMRGLALLTRLVRAELPAAVVIDEFGGVAGFVSLEDLVEVLIGDLIGEHETEHRRIHHLSPGVWRVEGSCRVDEFNAAAGDLLPEGEYDTVAGLFLDRSGHIPEAGEEVVLPATRLEVGAATDRRILWLRIERTDPPAQPSRSR